MFRLEADLEAAQRRIQDLEEAARAKAAAEPQESIVLPPLVPPPEGVMVRSLVFWGAVIATAIAYVITH